MAGVNWGQVETLVWKSKRGVEIRKYIFGFFWMAKIYSFQGKRFELLESVLLVKHSPPSHMGEDLCVSCASRASRTKDTAHLDT
jgi:hypothetical protein